MANSFARVPELIAGRKPKNCAASSVKDRRRQAAPVENRSEPSLRRLCLQALVPEI